MSRESIGEVMVNCELNLGDRGDYQAYIQNRRRVSVSSPLPRPGERASLTESRERFKALTATEEIMLWHFLAAAVDLQTRIDSAISSDLRQYGRLPAPAVMEVLHAVRGMSEVAQTLLRDVPALSSRLTVLAAKANVTAAKEKQG